MPRDRDPDHLHPKAKEKYKALSMLAHSACGIKTMLGETHRSSADQDADYAKGRNEHGAIVDLSKVVTYKKGGQGTHNLTRESDGTPMSAAFHLWIVLPDGQLLGLRRLGPAATMVYQALGECGRQLGLRWGGNWKDYTHFELEGEELTQAKEDARA